MIWKFDWLRTILLILYVSGIGDPSCFLNCGFTQKTVWLIFNILIFGFRTPKQSDLGTPMDLGVIGGQGSPKWRSEKQV